MLRNTEKIYIFRKDGDREVPFDLEYNSKISEDEHKEWVDSLWNIEPVTKQEGHPAQFPEEIPRRLIKMFSFKGDMVLDPFGGSMTTVKVANELGRVGIGYERYKRYKSIIMEKLGIKVDDLKKEDPQFEVVKEIEPLQESVKNDSTISEQVIEETEDYSVPDDYIENTEIEQDTEEQEPSKMTAKLIDLTDYSRGFSYPDKDPGNGGGSLKPSIDLKQGRDIHGLNYPPVPVKSDDYNEEESEELFSPSQYFNKKGEGL